jgi:hypothetical protein
VRYPYDFTAITEERASAVRVVRPLLAEEIIIVSEPLDASEGPEDEHRRLFTIAMNLDPQSRGTVAPPAKVAPTTCHGFHGVGSSTPLQVRPNGLAPIRVRLDACTTRLHGCTYLIATVVPEALEQHDRELLRRIDRAAELSTAAWHP